MHRDFLLKHLRKGGTCMNNLKNENSVVTGLGEIYLEHFNWIELAHN
jgi:hypothetical protein